MKNKSEMFIINLQSSNNINPKNIANENYIGKLLDEKYIKEIKEKKILNHNYDLQQNNNMWIDTTKESKSSLIEGYIQAYINNYSVTLNPDIIWLLITQGFSRYMYLNKTKENKIIFNDRKLNKIMITKESFYPLGTKGNDWKDIINDLYNKINSSLVDKISEYLLPKFSNFES